VPENPPKTSAISDDDVASIGNLIFIDQKLNNKLANKKVAEKVAILKATHVWVDTTILQAGSWTSAQIQMRAKALAREAFDKVWTL
jgi:hypothetical protein